MRHGQARPEEEDPQKSLSYKGRAEVETVAAAAGRLHVEPARVLHSGKLRAEQTAMLLAGALGLAFEPELADGIGPNDEVGPWRAELEGHDEDVMLVSHLPFLNRLASLLLCGREGDVILFPTGSMLCLERDGTGWQLVWLLTPEVARD